MTTFMEMLRANGGRTWEETTFQPGTYPIQKPYKEEELTPDQVEARLMSIRTRKTVQVGMPVVELMRIVKDSKRFNRFEMAAIADRCLSDTPLAKGTLHKLLGIVPNGQKDVLARLRIK